MVAAAPCCTLPLVVLGHRPSIFYTPRRPGKDAAAAYAAHTARATARAYNPASLYTPGCTPIANRLRPALFAGRPLSLLQRRPAVS